MAAERADSAGEGDDDERVVDEEVLAVVVRPSPRYGRFLGVGIVAGLIVAVVLTFITGAGEDPGGPLSTGASGALRVFGVTAAVCVSVGLVVMGTLALILDHISSKHARRASAEHATTLVVDLDAPAGDEVPAWVRDADDLT